jgi:hypothetical protein
MRLIGWATSFLGTVLILIVFELWSIKPEGIYYSGGIILAIHVVSIWLITKEHLLRKSFWNFFINPCVFLAGAFVFFALIDSAVVRQIYLVAVGLAYFLVMQNIYSFLHQTKDYQPYALENMYSYLNMLSLFLWTTSSYGYSLLLGWRNWFAIAPILVLTTWLFCRTTIAHKIPWRGHWFYLIVVGVVTAEAYYCFSLLPNSFLFNGLMVTTIYYFLSSVMRDYLAQALDARTTRRYIYISLAVFFMAFLTARWF